MNTNYLDVTELAGDEVSLEQLERLCSRYYWAGQYCAGRDVLEVACGTGQGLGYLAGKAKSIEAGDCSEQILISVRENYGERVKIQQFDAQDMPIADNSKDVVILFEAIYYLPDVEMFVQECRRILRPGGMVLIATANKDLYDFNPSPHSYVYFGAVELQELFSKFGFCVELFGGSPFAEVNLRQKILRPAKKIVVSLGLMPKTMAGKKLLKKLVFGNLVIMPAEITSGTAEYREPIKISGKKPDRVHKVLFCKAALQ